MINEGRTAGIIIAIIFGTMLAVIVAYTSIETEEESIPELVATPIETAKPIHKDKPVFLEEVAKKQKPILSDEDILAIMAECEAGNQELLGKVAVIATALNRCDYYGETVETVVLSPYQYAFDETVTPSEESYLAVQIAMRERELFPRTMMWFMPNDWSQYGDHYMPIQDHYFSYIQEEE